MNFLITIIARPIINKLVALQNFFFARPIIDIDLISNPESLYGQKLLGNSDRQNYSEPVPIPYVIYDYEFYWNYKIRIKNNSSKTAYNLKIERIFKESQDYLQNIESLISLKENEIIELDYTLKHRASKNGVQAKQLLNKFPMHIDKIEILVSYTNESRKKFYTKFIVTKETSKIEHLILNPKNKN
jgi:hypothetical protein